MQIKALKIKGRLVPNRPHAHRKELDEVLVIGLNFEDALATYRNGARKLDPGTFDVTVEVASVVEVELPGVLVSEKLMQELQG